jgi:ribA/ribD-fused uncharacterized protein
MVSDIYFYFNKEEYGWLSNFERIGIIIDGNWYNTNEHYYQSQKANSDINREWIRNAPSPYLAMMAGRSLREKEKKSNWDNIKFDIMEKGLFAKFSQNEELKKKLIETGDAKLYWGVKGEDRLGKLLMKVREELRIKV